MAAVDDSDVTTSADAVAAVVVEYFFAHFVEDVSTEVVAAVVSTILFVTASELAVKAAETSDLAVTVVS